MASGALAQSAPSLFAVLALSPGDTISGLTCNPDGTVQSVTVSGTFPGGAPFSFTSNTTVPVSECLTGGPTPPTPTPPTPGGGGSTPPTPSSSSAATSEQESNLAVADQTAGSGVDDWSDDIPGFDEGSGKLDPESLTGADADLWAILSGEYDDVVDAEHELADARNNFGRQSSIYHMVKSIEFVEDTSQPGTFVIVYDGYSNGKRDPFGEGIQISDEDDRQNFEDLYGIDTGPLLEALENGDLGAAQSAYGQLVQSQTDALIAADDKQTNAVLNYNQLVDNGRVQSYNSAAESASTSGLAEPLLGSLRYAPESVPFSGEANQAFDAINQALGLPRSSGPGGQGVAYVSSLLPGQHAAGLSKGARTLQEQVRDPARRAVLRRQLRQAFARQAAGQHGTGVSSLQTWVSTNHNFSDDNRRGAEADGDQTVIEAGALMRVHEDVVIGAKLRYRHLDSQRRDRSISTEADGFGGAVFARFSLPQGAVLTPLVALEFTRTDLDLTAGGTTLTGTFDTDILTIGGTLSREFTFEDQDNNRTFYIEPNLSLSYVTARRSAYTRSDGAQIPGTRVDTGTLSFNPTFGVRLYDVGTMLKSAEPFIGVSGVWNFETPNDFLSTSGTLVETPDLFAGINGGISIETEGGMRGTLRATYSGLGSDIRSTSIFGQLTIPLDGF